MSLSSEQVHWIGGAATVVVAVSLLLREAGIVSNRRLDWLLPVFLALYGMESFVDPWVHGTAIPAHYGSESSQHVIQGSAMLAAGIVEALILYGALNSRGWLAALPAALVVLGLVFLFHAEHGASVPPLVIQVQHRAFALTLLVAAATRALLLLPGQGAKTLASGWLILLLLFGLELLTYTEHGSQTMMHGGRSGS
jgi:hypothetical protein